MADEFYDTHFTNPPRRLRPAGRILRFGVGRRVSAGVITSSPSSRRSYLSPPRQRGVDRGEGFEAIVECRVAV